MSNATIFNRYKQIGEVLGAMFPNLLEVVIHDFTDLDHSVIFIVNGHLSGREIGSGASELGIRRLLAEESIPDVLINYANVNLRGNSLKSASIAIRDDAGQMIGAFCLNCDVSVFELFYKFLEPLICRTPLSIVGESELSPLSGIEEEVKMLTQDYLLQNSLLLSQLNYSEKKEIVLYLSKKGIFKQKGSMLATATALKLTRQCIYNYLKSNKVD